jgi:cysteine desulfurase
MPVYLDNAATTPLDPKVLEAMLPYFNEVYGNPSSIHSAGRQSRAAIERARRIVAELLGCAPSEIFFTSGATESNNTALRQATLSFGIQHIIASPLEHPCVLETIKQLEKEGVAKLHWLSVNEKGEHTLAEIATLLTLHPNALVTCMHGNNEIGNQNPIEEIALLCAEHRALFHCDAVQTLGHLRFNLNEGGPDYISGSAHKLHGPKGIGLLYIRAGKAFAPMIRGGSQERNMRAGTENTAAIVGFATALELAIASQIETTQHLRLLKQKAIHKIQEQITGSSINGLGHHLEQSLPHILNIDLPPSEMNEMLVFNMDIEGVACSAGSACSSGSQIGSHVLEALGTPNNRGYLRFSFSKYTTESDINLAIDALSRVLSRA